MKRAQPIGQLDPFRPLSRELQDLVVKPKDGAAKGQGAASLSGKPQPLVTPPGWQLSGLIGGADRPEAVVTYLGASGTLRVGDVGSATGKGAHATNLLPDGWRVAEIDPTRGTIVLQFKGQTTTKQI
ncbi:MAG: hypothetical protein ACK5N0_11250 [Synechococcaceae cyanobacterium]